MLPSQKAAVGRHMVELTETVEGKTPVLFSYLQQRGVITYSERQLLDSKVIDADKLYLFFHILEAKEIGWTHLLSYLRDNSQSCMAEKLQNDAEFVAGIYRDKRQKRSALEEFSCWLAQYYQQNYAYVPTMGETPKHVKDVWVPLAMDGRSEKHLAADRIDHDELISRLKADGRCNVALIKGDPGMGKTTLAKKIAYDWAVNYGSTEAQQFALVLAVPLRSAGKSNLFDLLAIDYFLSIFDSDDVNKSALIGEIRHLKSRLLVILDGLDEYRSYSDSPFKNSFAAPFQHSTANFNVPMPMIAFKLIITSRPYACHWVKDDFPVLRFSILPLSKSHLDELVHLYCQTPHGVNKVTEYLNVKDELVIQVPLILTFVCFLAESSEEIPTNVTSLYISLIRQMLRREIHRGQGKMDEKVNILKWKESNVVKSTGELAYRGSTEYFKANENYKAVMFEFSSDTLEKCHVTNDSFICGFLLHKFDFANDCLMAEFPHRSIQEFFAALHCYQLMMSGCRDVMEEVNKLIVDAQDSPIGRFFFGICSSEGRFRKMTEWLRPSAVFSGAMISPETVIERFGACLVDCSSDENRLIGLKLFESLGQLAEVIVASWDEHINIEAVVRFGCSNDFTNAAHFGVLCTNTFGVATDWFFGDNGKSARLVYIDSSLLEPKFDTIDMLILANYDVKYLASELKSLCPIKALVIVCTYVIPDISVTICINYGEKCESRVTCFRLEYEKIGKNLYGSNTLSGLENVERENFVDLTVDERKEKEDEGQTFRQLKVTVNDDICQSTLIVSLIRLALLEDVDANERSDNFSYVSNEADPTSPAPDRLSTNIHYSNTNISPLLWGLSLLCCFLCYWYLVPSANN